MDGGGSTKEMERQRSAIRDELKRTGEKLDSGLKQKRRSSSAPDQLSIGDMVMVHSLGVKGTVSTLPNAKGKLFVQMGIMR